MPLPSHRGRPAALLASCALLAAVALPVSTTTATAGPTRPAAPDAPAARVGLSTVTVAVPSAFDDAPFDRTRQVQVPAGWTVSVWARREAPRLMALAPDGRVLVSRPGNGKVTRLTPHGAGRRHVEDAAERAAPAARARLRRFHALRRGEPPHQPLHVHEGQGRQAAHRAQGVAGRQERRPAGHVRPCAQEPRGRTGPRALRLRRLDRERVGRRPRPHPAARVRAAHRAGEEHRDGPSPAASGTGPGWPWRPTARCGPR